LVERVQSAKKPAKGSAWTCKAVMTMHRDLITKLFRAFENTTGWRLGAA
jgi:hypothetical protein